MKSYYECNKERIKARAAARYLAKKDEILAGATERARKYRNTLRGQFCFALINARKAAKRYKAACLPVTIDDLQRLYTGQKGFCFYCHERPARLTIEHQVPLSRGGLHAVDNIVLACGVCNFRKQNLTAEEWRPETPTARQRAAAQKAAKEARTRQCTLCGTRWRSQAIKIGHWQGLCARCRVQRKRGVGLHKTTRVCVDCGVSWQSQAPRTKWHGRCQPCRKKERYWRNKEAKNDG